MEITKYGHACVVVTKNEQSVIIDPGTLSPDFVAAAHPVAIVITHLHPDHWSAEHLQAIPGVPIFAPDDAVIALKRAGFNATAAHAGDVITAGEFSLTFTGGKHAVIHPSVPMCHNVGVLINDGEFYYPGDSFADPGVPIDTLALPIAAPWMKTSEAMDFLTSVKPNRAIPTHDAVLSDAGKQVTDNWMKIAARNAGTRYERL